MKLPTLDLPRNCIGDRAGPRLTLIAHVYPRTCTIHRLLVTFPVPLFVEVRS